MTAPVLYGAAYSVYTRIARLALAEKGVAHGFEEVDIFAAAGPPAAYLRRHPFGRIPALAHAGFALYETAAICRYVDEAFAGPALQPSDPRERARMAQIIAILDAYAYRPMVWDIFVEQVRKPLQGEASDAAKIAAAVTASERCLGVLAGFLGQGFLGQGVLSEAQWLAGGEALTLADLHAAPMLAYLAAAPAGAVLLRRHPAISAWLARLQGRPSMQATPSPLLG